MGRHYKPRLKSPRYRGAQLLFVTAMAGLLAVVTLIRSDVQEADAWTPANPESPISSTLPQLPWPMSTLEATHPTETQHPVIVVEKPAASAPAKAPSSSSPRSSFRKAESTAPSTAASTGRSRTSPGSSADRIFSPPKTSLPESIQVPMCKGTASQCFTETGLTFDEHLTVFNYDPVTGRVCFQFQPECSRGGS